MCMSRTTTYLQIDSLTILLVIDTLYPALAGLHYDSASATCSQLEALPIYTLHMLDPSYVESMPSFAREIRKSPYLNL